VFRERLNSEFAARRQSNPRYSLRAFAAFLETDHSTLSQVLKGSRRAPVKQLRAWCRKLGISPEEITVFLAAEHVPDAGTAERQAQLRHWTAEAMAIVSGREHWKIVRLSRHAEFRADCRWIADQAGVSVDEVNLALTRLLRLGLIDGNWKARAGIARLGEEEFRKLALAKVQEKAAEDHVKFGSSKG
jgi:transcriptional regulator with XRE-family HTH domain